MNDVSPYNAAVSTHTALSAAEAWLMPEGARSRLFAAVEVADITVSYLAYESDQTRASLLKALNHLRLVESNAVDMNNLPPDSLVGRGLSLGIYIAQMALGASVPTSHAMREAREIVKLAARIEAAA